MNVGLPETAKQALQMWDSNDGVVTLGLSGIGPSHEQAIHVTVFELLRLTRCVLPPSSKKASEILDKFLNEIDRVKHLHLSNNQAASAKHLAFMYVRFGYK